MYKGLLSFGRKLVLACLMTLSFGVLVCLKLWSLFKRVLCVSTFLVTFHCRQFSPNLIRA